MVCGKCKMNNTNAVCYCNSCFQNARIKSKEEGRVEGAINELESLHKLINNDLNYGHLLIRKQINDLIKKRLKSLESEKK